MNYKRKNIPYFHIFLLYIYTKIFIKYNNLCKCNLFFLRWWPAQIVFPNQVPDAVNAIKHSVGQFAVRFFGSYNYNWVNHGRVFNFHEGVIITICV